MVEGAQRSPAPAADARAGKTEAEARADAALAELEQLVRRAQKRGVHRLSTEELTGLPVLYRFAMTRLSREQTSGRDPRRIQALSRLLSDAHALLYRDL